MSSRTSRMGLIASGFGFRVRSGSGFGRVRGSRVPGSSASGFGSESASASGRSRVRSDAGPGFRYVDDDPGQRAVAERHEDARADDWHRQRLGDAVRQRVERAERERRRNEAHRRLLGGDGRHGRRRGDLAAEDAERRSSGRPRLPACCPGLRSRNDGWNVGISLAPRILEDAAAQPRDRVRRS